MKYYESIRRRKKKKKEVKNTKHCRKLFVLSGDTELSGSVPVCEMRGVGSTHQGGEAMNSLILLFRFILCYNELRFFNSRQPSVKLD